MGFLAATLSAVFSSSKDLLSKRLAFRLDGTSSTFASFAFALPFYIAALVLLYALGLESFERSVPFLVLVLLRSHGYNGPFNLDYKPPRTTSTHGVFAVSFPAAVDRFITLWEMAGEVLTDAIIKEATDALKAGGGATDTRDAEAIAAANRELLTLHELLAHRLVQILLGLHRGRTYSV